MRPYIRILLLVFISLTALNTLNINASAKSNWPQWRGPAGQGISNEKNLPTTWTATKNIKWKTPIEGLDIPRPSFGGRRYFSPLLWMET